MSVTHHRKINALVDEAFVDLNHWRTRGGSYDIIAHAYSCLGNALKLIKTERE